MEQRKNRQFVKTNDLAEILNVSPECVRSWIFRGKIPVKRFGRAVRIEGEVAERIIRQGLGRKSSGKDRS